MDIDIIKSISKWCGSLSHRALFVIRGEDAANQIPYLHHSLKKHTTFEKETVLWCHSRDATLPKSTSKSLKGLEKKIKSGEVKLADMQPLDVLLLAAGVRFCNYGSTKEVLGNTYSMCVMQDLEQLTPNTLCQCVETVAGGGCVVLLLPHAEHLRDFARQDMAAHHRLATYAYPTVEKLFNWRFLVSLSWCKTALVMDGGGKCRGDVSGLSGRAWKDDPLPELDPEPKEKLAALISSMSDAEAPLPQLLALCKTHDQAQSLLKLVDVLTERSAKDVVSVTAARGRGKSAVLGLAVAAAIHLGLNSVCVSAPSPHNLSSFFSLLFKGFDALGYQEGTDYEIETGNNREHPELVGAILRVRVRRRQRQTVEYVAPEDHSLLGGAELVVVDEAAAIPLPLVAGLIRGRTSLISSTVSGYEGTGRSLSLKLLKQLRGGSARGRAESSLSGRVLHELSLAESIRYGPDDPVEAWLYRLLCLDACDRLPVAETLPLPSQCRLYRVNRRVLFSGAAASEAALASLTSLLTASHYRNTPDDLLSLSDAPAHRLYVLLPPLRDGGAMPAVFAVLQVCLEGGMPRKEVKAAQREGRRPAGDLVPWCLVGQFQETGPAEASSVRVIRVATHPNYQSMGYGSEAISQFCDHLSGKLVDLEAVSADQDTPSSPVTPSSGHVKVVSYPDPLFEPMSDVLPPKVSYVSVSYGITTQLYKFWEKAGFLPLYVGQSVNKTTGEHNCVMVKPVTLQGDEEDDGENGSKANTLPDWLQKDYSEFISRFTRLVSFPLRGLDVELVRRIVKKHLTDTEPPEALTVKQLEAALSSDALRCLSGYTDLNAHWHVAAHLFRRIAELYFSGRLRGVSLSNHQEALLVGCGLQDKDVLAVGDSLGFDSSATLGNLKRALTRIGRQLTALREAPVRERLSALLPDLLVPVDVTVAQEVALLAREVDEEKSDVTYTKKKRKDLNALQGGAKRHKKFKGDRNK